MPGAGTFTSEGAWGTWRGHGARAGGVDALHMRGNPFPVPVVNVPVPSSAARSDAERSPCPRPCFSSPPLSSPSPRYFFLPPNSTESSDIFPGPAKSTHSDTTAYTKARSYDPPPPLTKGSPLPKW